MAKTRKTVRKAREPEVGSDEWYAREQEKPGFALAEMKNLSNMIAQGNKWAVKSLEKWIAKFPDVARSLSDLGDLCAATEAAWVNALAGENPLDKLGLNEEVARMKAELLGENPSLLEKVMVSSVVTAHLAHQRASVWASRPAQHQGVTTARDKRVESTSRRLLLAVKALAVVRQQQARGLTPKTKLKLFDGTA